MSGSEHVGGHLRRNAVGYLALFIALTGTSYAANKIKGNEIAKNAITSKLIKDGQVKSGDVADDGLTGADIDEASLQNVPVLLADGSVTTAKLADAAVTLPKLADAAVSLQKLAFDPATQAELDAVATGAAPANNSLGAAEPPAADDQIVDGSIDAQDVSAEVALRGADQVFTGENSFTGDFSVSTGAGEEISIASGRSGNESFDVFDLHLVNQTTSGIQRVAAITNSFGSGDTEQILRLNNLDNDTAVDSGLLLSSSGGMTTGVDASDSDIGTALAIGANDIDANGTAISATELAKLDGTPTHTISLPLGSFLNATDSSGINFTSGADDNPDYVFLAGAPVIEYDADAGDEDADDIVTTLTVPADYASGGTVRIRVGKATHVPGVPVEVVTCRYGVNGGTGTPLSASIVGTAPLSYGLAPTATLNDHDTVALSCHVEASTPVPYDDAVRIHSVAFEYTAER